MRRQWARGGTKGRKVQHTHLWSDGFSRDSGLKGAREKVKGMQCKSKRPEGKKEGGKERWKEGSEGGRAL